ncbi:ankyrin repeat-containing protein [Podospora appendiculata]|uniref:Ankyrin repeat-containing protein n=1 Tax=Podospora appendiculata TaxID=314037 RepID=A0AAE0X9U3_9PEZI|nr:ankyrin repeat-containing protein [Podospora appendiculata]
MSANPYLLAADDPAALISLLREQPSLAAGQDDHGYSLLHATASYNHLDILRSLVRDYNVPVDLRDEDGETALFVVETVEAAKVLVEELGLDAGLKNDEGLTARENFEAESESPEVAEYLLSLESGAPAVNGATTNGSIIGSIDPLDGLQVTVGTMEEADATGLQPDPEFRRRIEELAAREDFQTSAGQEELRRLVEEVLTGQGVAPSLSQE